LISNQVSKNSSKVEERNELEQFFKESKSEDEISNDQVDFEEELEI
jgi:hypothetical protein